MVEVEEQRERRTELMKKIVLKFIVLLLISMIFSCYVNAKNDSKLSAEEVYGIAKEIGNKYSICPELLQSIAFHESGYDPNAKNGSCLGLMQVSQKWHEDWMKKLNANDLYDPYENMNVAAHYLLELFNKYEDVGIVLMVYNGDSRAFENGYISDYANNVLELSMELEIEHEKNEGDFYER